MDIHGCHGYPWMPWISMDAMVINGCHGYPWMLWISMDAMGIHGCHGYPWMPWISMASIILTFFYRKIKEHPKAVVKRARRAQTRLIRTRRGETDHCASFWPMLKKSIFSEQNVL